MADVVSRAAAPTPVSREEAGVAGLHTTIFLVLGAVLVVLPFVPVIGYPFLLMKVLCFALFACAFNLMLGYGGLLSFGHAAYFGMASYVSAFLAKYGFQLIEPRIAFGFRGTTLIDVTLPLHVDLPPFSPELAILAGTACAGLLGLAFGSLAIRRQGIYFAMITLALAQMAYFFSLQTPRFTGGEDGIQAVPRNNLFGVIPIGDDRSCYYLVAAIFLLGVLLIYRIIHSPFGQVLKAIRDNEPRAISLGYRTSQYKLAVFVLSATLAGLAGGTKAIAVQLASLTDVHWSMSGEVVLMTLIGGMGTVFGPIVGSVVIVFMQNFLATWGAWVTVIQGCIFVFFVLVFREGVVGGISKLIKRPL